MPFAKCMFYSENGEPVRGGCHKKATGNCAFIHPDDPNWSKARPSKGREKSGSDSGSFKSWGNYTAPSGSAASTSISTSGADTAGGWGSPGAWGDTSGSGDKGGWGNESGWGDGNGWGNGSGWGTTDTGPSPTPNQAPAAPIPALHNSPVAATPAPMNEWPQPDASSSGNRESSWGNVTGSGWGNVGDSNKDTITSWGAPEPWTTDKQSKEPERSKGKGRAVPAPPRIRIPNYENKKNNITGTNSEPLGPSKWGETPNIATMSTPLTTSTLVVAPTPTEPSRVKRKRDAAFDDKADVFKEYVKAWERGVRTRLSLAEAETKRNRWYGTQKSACYARIGEAGRKKLDGQRADYDKEVNSQREKLSSAITSLVEFHDTFSSKLDLGQRYNIGEEANRFIAESKAFVDEVRALLVANVLKDKDNASMQKPQPETDTALFDSLRDKVQDLEERFEQAQTELTLRRQPDIRPVIDELLTDKIAALRAAREREIERVVSQPPEIVIPPGAVDSMEATAQRVREMDAKVPHTVEDIRVLLLRVDATAKRVDELEQELSKNRVAYRENTQKMAAEKEEIERRLDERLVKVQEQLQSVTSQAAQPATPPTIFNSRDKLMESLQPEFEAVLNTFYEREIRPTIETLQQVVIETSSRQQEASFKELWSRIQPAMNMVSGVCRWLDSQELGRTAPVPAE